MRSFCSCWEKRRRAIRSSREREGEEGREDGPEDVEVEVVEEEVGREERVGAVEGRGRERGGGCCCCCCGAGGACP